MKNLHRTNADIESFEIVFCKEKPEKQVRVVKNQLHLTDHQYSDQHSA